MWSTDNEVSVRAHTMSGVPHERIKYTQTHSTHTHTHTVTNSSHESTPAIKVDNKRFITEHALACMCACVGMWVMMRNPSNCKIDRQTG